MKPVKYRLGNLDLAIISDGDYYRDAGATFGLVPRIMWEPIAGPLDERHRVTLALNSVLLRSKGRLILIETGVGDKPGGARRDSSPAEQGTLLSGLDYLGVRPEEIDVVINTHLHSDHCGWNTRIVNGKAVPTFPNATYHAVRAEWEAAMTPNERTRATYLAENLLPIEEHGRLDLVDSEYNVTDEVTIVPVPGHSDGHCAIVLASAGEKAVYLGDVVQVPVQLERMAWVSAFDIYPMAAIESKRELVETAIEEHSLLINCHLEFPGIGRMERTPQGHRHYAKIDASELAPA
jgi:glyoxylase-like metal-dependent hydrolase (beta-lactamase superfamily II)